MPATPSLSARPGARSPRSTRRPPRGAEAAAARVRWDRLGRIALLAVLLALVYLYASAGVRMISTWRQSRHDRAAVTALQREHRALVRQHEALSGQSALEEQARKLGMMRRGEQPYIVGGLPGN